MKGGLYLFGRALQILGMFYAGMALLSAFGQPDMYRMLKDAGLGLLEFYLGWFIVSRTGEKTQPAEEGGK